MSGAGAKRKPSRVSLRRSSSRSKPSVRVDELSSANPATRRDFELMPSSEVRAKLFGLNVVSAFEKWSDGKLGM
jgi:hypothetical protein